jgi:hypothetical protein
MQPSSDLSKVGMYHVHLQVRRSNALACRQAHWQLNLGQDMSRGLQYYNFVHGSQCVLSLRAVSPHLLCIRYALLFLPLMSDVRESRDISNLGHHKVDPAFYLNHITYKYKQHKCP